MLPQSHRLHPCLGGLGHILHVPHADTIGNHCRHTVDHFQSAGILTLIRDRNFSDQCGDGLLRKHIIGHLCPQSALRVLLCDPHMIPAYFHLLCQLFPGKRLIKPTVFFNKCAESGAFYILICYMCRIEFHNGMLFVLYAEAYDTLPPVHIKTPHGDSAFPRNSREKSGKY